MHELLLGEVILIDSGIGLVNQALVVLVLFRLWFHCFPLRQFHVDDVEEDFSAAHLVGLTLYYFAVLVVL